MNLSIIIVTTTIATGTVIIVKMNYYQISEGLAVGCWRQQHNHNELIQLRKPYLYRTDVTQQTTGLTLK